MLRSRLSPPIIALCLLTSIPSIGTTQEARRHARSSWQRDPRSAVLGVLTLVVVVGGGRKLLQSLRARRVVARLEDEAVSPAEILAASIHGRDVLMDLFRLLSTAPDAHQREAAGRALSTLWAGDQLVSEEEEAIVARGFEVAWHARRRYPRALRSPFPVVVEFGLPFLDPEGTGVRPDQLEWSYRFAGSERAALEADSPWGPGPIRAAVPVDPSDFPTNGPHRLVLKARARPSGLSGNWELELPHVPFTFEFDPVLAPEALLTLPDAGREQAIGQAVQLHEARADATPPSFLPITPDFALRDPPVLTVRTPLPCDLAHRLEIELEGLPGCWRCEPIVLSGQGVPQGVGQATYPLVPIGVETSSAPDRPGDYRLRVIMTADVDLAWADPQIRSVWPGKIVTDWIPVRLIRR